MRNIIGLALLAVVLAFVAVQGATLLQGPLAPAMLKGESVAETGGARYEATQTTSESVLENFPTIVLGSFVIAALCYIFVRKRM